MTKREHTQTNGQNHSREPRAVIPITTTITSTTKSSTLPSSPPPPTTMTVVDIRSQVNAQRRRHKVPCCTARLPSAFPPSPFSTILLLTCTLSLLIPTIVCAENALLTSSTSISPSTPPRAPLLPSSPPPLAGHSLHSPEAQASSPYTFHRPSPFSPEYRPDCDLIFPASSKPMVGDVVHESEPPSAFLDSAPAPPSSLPTSSHFGAAYFSQLDNQPPMPPPQGDGFLANDDVSSFFSNSPSVSKPTNAYLSSFAPRYVPLVVLCHRCCSTLGQIVVSILQARQFW